MSEDGTFDTSAASASSSFADAAKKAGEPVKIGEAKGIDFPETEEERERKLREEEEDKTPARKSISTYVLLFTYIYIFNNSVSYLLVLLCTETIILL